MRTVLDQIKSWLGQGQSVALATVIKTWGSSPRPAGAVMGISEKSEISGSVSGGCVEGAVIDAALRVLQSGGAERLHFGVANEEAWQVGLSCGGEIEVYVRLFNSQNLRTWEEALQRERIFSSILILEGNTDLRGREWIVFEDGEMLSEPSSARPPEELVRSAVNACQLEETSLQHFPSRDFEEVFLNVQKPPRTLIVVGGVHIAIPLVSLAKTIGFEVIVIDPRRLFGTDDRFPQVRSLLQMWPQDAFKQVSLTTSTAVVMLTHDPKIDDPAIQEVVNSPVFYIGALGSRKTHNKRLKRLEELGLKREQLNRIHAPVGLDLGGSAPEEIALAIMAEILQTWHSKG